MRNITVSVDDDTYRLSRVGAAERAGGETEAERRERLVDEVFQDICATRSGFKAADNVSREALYDRNAIC